MKRFLTIAAALALMLGLSQCKKTRPDMPQYSGSVGDMYIQQATLKASQQKNNSKVADDGLGCVEWEKDDVITVSGGGTGTLTCTEANGKDGLFTGTITKVSDDELIFTYGELSSSFLNQTGSLTKALHLEGTNDFELDGEYDVEMSIDYALLKLDLSALGTSGDGNEVKIYKEEEAEPVATVLNVKDDSKVLYVAIPTDVPSTTADPAEITYRFVGNNMIVNKLWGIKQNTFYTNEVEVGNAIVVAPPFASIVTIPVCAIHANCASSGGVVIGAGVEEQGVCWGTGENPTVNDSKYVHQYEYSSGNLTPKAGLDPFSKNTFTGFMSGLTAGTTYHVRAYIRKGIQVEYGDDLTFTTLTSEPEIEYVDFGLPSGRLWAKCNLGAVNEYDYGDYYMWGDNAACASTVPGKTVIPGHASYRFAANSSSEYTKYGVTGMETFWYSGAGSPDNKTQLDIEDDCVRQTLGGDWRMPTYADWVELCNNTTRKWTSSGGEYGRLFTGKGEYTSVSMFIPGAGFSSSETGLHYGNCLGRYWSSSLNSFSFLSNNTIYNICDPYILYFHSGFILPEGYDVYVIYSNNRCSGYSVRPVR